MIADYHRQVEILARALNGELLSKSDFAHIYDTAEITISRDLKTLRNYGIQIFSRNGKVKIIEPPPKDALIELCSNYLPVKLNSDVFKNQVEIFSHHNPLSFFNKLILISKSVEEGYKIKIDYKRFYDNEIRKYVLEPVRLFSNELNWLLHAYKEGEDILKTFYLSRVVKIEVTKSIIKIMPLKTENSKKYEMVFRFNPKVKDQIYDKIWFEDFSFEENEDGYVILKTAQPITNKLAGWCVSWWDMIEVLEPEILKQEIAQMIKQYWAINSIGDC